MKLQIDILPEGKVVYEVLEREANENCSHVALHLVQGLSIESDERTGPDCDEVREQVSNKSY